jgi:hypothetical protein
MCGHVFTAKVANISNGQKTCGHCNDVTLKHKDTYGSLAYLGQDIKISAGSNKLIQFRCSCGNDKTVQAKLVFNGKIRSCGKCSKISLKHGDEYFGFKYLGQTVEVFANSPNKLLFQCKCGKSSERSIRTVTTGLAKTCGRCNEIFLEHGQEYFDFTYYGESATVSPGSKKKLPFKCRCGVVKNIQIGSITRRVTTKCGLCHTLVDLWYEENKEKIRGIKCPASKADFPPGGVVPLEVVFNTTDSFKAICPACSNTYRPYLHSIKRGISLTCGCTNDTIPRWNRQLAEFIKSIGENVICEFLVNGVPYDIAIPDKKLLIELNGLRWHSGVLSRQRDARKFALAKENGYNIIVLFEDEWEKKCDIMKSIIANRLGCNKPKKIRPNNCVIKVLSAKYAFEFYEQFHYIGGAPSSIHYGVFHAEELIGCISFRKPVRQKCFGEYEISRMAMNPKYHVHGIWSKILQLFTKSNGVQSIITFSDNRLFTGRVYELMGFRNDGQIRPDYYWVKNRVRHHKSSLRKPEGCYETENSFRRNQGYTKIWDYGKTRWRWCDLLNK